MREIRPNRAFVAQGSHVNDGDLSRLLHDAANTVAGIQLLDPTATIRIYHNIDEEGHSIMVFVEAD